MGEKSLQKKQYILETAKKVFVEKGYKNVTMKDIVEACDISRGGLYLYFSSTEELLLAVLQQDAEELDDVFTESIEEDSAADILTLFLKEQKKELLRKRNNLTMAVYEYAFENREKKDQMLRRQFDAGVRVLEKLIESGIASGEFYCENPRGAANNIMYVLEGMKINSQTMGITEAMVDEQLLYIMERLLIDID